MLQRSIVVNTSDLAAERGMGKAFSAPPDGCSTLFYITIF